MLAVPDTFVVIRSVAHRTLRAVLYNNCRAACLTVTQKSQKQNEYRNRKPDAKKEADEVGRKKEKG
jgi:hypothetical protein